MRSTIVMPPHHYLNDGYGVKSWLMTRRQKAYRAAYLAPSPFLLFTGGASPC